MANRRKKKPSPNASAARIKAVVAMLIIGAFSAFGLWRCFDTNSGSPLDPAKQTTEKKPVDVGKNKTPDPTLINEADLLKAEDSPTPLIEKVAPKDGEEAEHSLSIEEAGKKIVEKTEEEKLEKKYPLHAVAYHFHTQIKAEPKTDAKVISYARRGSTFRVSERVSTKGCKKGWHEIAGGGFVCDGLGINVAKTPVTFAPAPPKPKLDLPLPYKYMYAKSNNTPEFWRIPAEEEFKKTEEIFKRLAIRNQNATQAPSVPPVEIIKKKDKDALAAVLEKASQLALAASDSGVDEAPNIKSPETVAPQKAPGKTTPDPVDVQTLSDGGVTDPLALPAYVHLRMAKGYFVSVDDTVTKENRTFHRTVRGRFIEKDKLYPAKASSLEGVLINNSAKLPLVFIVRGGVKKLIQTKEGGPLKAGDRIARYTTLPMLGKLKRKNKRYLQIGENEFISTRAAAIAELREPPKGLLPTERWIDINLSEQTLVAYEGANPVFATLISSGRKDFDTPEGEFRIYGKHVAITMDDPDGGEEAYSIEDVPWTQYFDEGYALHAAFWHDRFGRVRSHGCINLAPADARRLFFWTGPHIFPGIHGQIATRENPGTRIVIHK